MQLIEPEDQGAGDGPEARRRPAAGGHASPATGSAWPAWRLGMRAPAQSRGYLQPPRWRRTRRPRCWRMASSLSAAASTPTTARSRPPGPPAGPLCPRRVTLTAPKLLEQFRRTRAALAFWTSTPPPDTNLSGAGNVGWFGLQRGWTNQEWTVTNYIVGAPVPVDEAGKPRPALLRQRPQGGA